MFALLRRPVVLVLAFVAFAVSARAAGDEHLVMGNPSAATADKKKPNNYLIKKRQYALSYNNSRGTPNWVSWHLGKKWRGDIHRKDLFAPDTSLPEGFLVVRPNDYRGSGFDRGHLCPAADRSAAREDNDATFLMTNMMPQAPDLNRGPWEKLEHYCRDQVSDGDQVLYIVAGPAGRGGVGSEGTRTDLQGARGKITVPSSCWKVVLVLPLGITDPSKVSAKEARVFAVIMPNRQGLDTAWRSHAVPVADVEKLTGYTFFTRLPRKVAKEIRSRKPETREKAKGKGLELPAFVKGCIVGNSVSKKYHVPGGRYYEAGIKSRNAVFFKNEADAKKAGYTAASR